MNDYKNYEVKKDIGVMVLNFAIYSFIAFFSMCLLVVLFGLYKVMGLYVLPIIGIFSPLLFLIAAGIAAGVK